MELGKRLTKVADLVLPAEVLADVGCDHGYLSIYLVEKQRCRRIIAMDINKGPLEKARENICKFDYGDYIETRLSNGLNKLNAKEAEGFVCAGMGGPLALEILWNDRDKVKDMKQIVLQPQSELWLVRRTLKKWGFIIEKEDIELEEGKYYFMMRIRPGETLCMTEAPRTDASLFDEISENGTDEDIDMISEKTLEDRGYELFAKELLEEKNSLLQEYIRKEEKRLLDVYQNLCRQEDSAKCRKRMRMIKKELAIHQWALSQYETQ